MKKSITIISTQLITNFSILVTVWSLCIAWPLYQVLIEGATFFAAHNASRIEIFLLILAISFVLPITWALICTLAGIFSRWVRNALFAIGVAAPLVLFFAKTFIYKPWSWLPLWGVWVLGALLLCLTMMITIVFSRLRLTWKGSMAGVAVACLVIGLFIFSPSMVHFFFPISSQLSVKKTTGLGYEKKLNIVILLFDELSLVEMLSAKDHINEKLFPNFAKLSIESIWFPNSYAIASQTHLNVPSIFTGILPSKDNLPPTRKNHPLSIIQLLEQRGYNIYAKEEYTNIFSSQRFRAKIFFRDILIIFYNVMLPPTIISSTNIPSISQGWAGFGGLSVDDSAKRVDWNKRDYKAMTNSFFDSIDYGNKFFAFYHLLLPHWPYIFLHDGSSPNLGQFGFGDDGTPLPRNRDVINIIKMQYLQQACYADAILGHIIEKMKQNDIYDKTVLIVVSDHGIINEQGKKRKIYDDSDIPLDVASAVVLMKMPGEKNIIVHDFMRHVDILPTLMHSLNWNIPWKTDGKSLLVNPIPPNEDDLLFFGEDMKGEYRVKREEFMRRYKDRLEQKRKVFSPDYKNAAEIYFSDENHLGGSNVSAYQQIAQQKNTAFIEGAHFYKNINPNNHFYPVYVKGKLRTEASSTIAFALNGKIYYVGNLFEDNENKGTYNFIGYFPPAAFVAGNNKVELFAPVNHHGQVCLSPIRFKEPFAHLISFGTIRYNDKKIDISNLDSLEGRVDEYDDDNNVLTLKGWAIDKKRVSGVDEVLLFMGDQAVAFSGPLQSRPDLVNYFQEPRYELSGFWLTVPNVSAKDISDARVVVVSGDFAKELPLPSSLFTKVLTNINNVTISMTGVLNWKGKKFLPCTAEEEIKGFIDYARLDNNNLVINGWAVDFVNKNPVEGLLVIINNVATLWQTPYIRIPNLVNAFNNEAYRKSGFYISVPRSSIKLATDASIDDVKVYALSKGRYSRLMVPKK